MFNPDAETDESLPDNPGEAYREVFLKAKARLARIREQCGLNSEVELPADAVAPGLEGLVKVNEWLRQVWQICSTCKELELRVEEERKRLAALKETDHRLKRPNLDLTRLLRPDALLDARLGQVPSTNVRRLRDALAGQVLSPFDQAEGQTFAVVAGPRQAGEGVSGLLAQAGWRELPVPVELQTHPDAARQYIEEEEQRLEATAALHCQKRKENPGRFDDQVREAAVQLALARPLADAAGVVVRGRRHLAVFTGWVPRRALDELKTALEERLRGRYWMTVREPRKNKAGRVPSLVSYPVRLRPFLPR